MPGALENRSMPRDVEFCARDGVVLRGRIWESPKTDSAEYVSLINAGAGIASSYYDRFGAFLADRNIPTLVYDYRGIGRSKPKTLRGFDASVEEWGCKDCDAALEWLCEAYPSSKRIVVGHSVGGFVTGFITNGELVDAMLLISAHTGYWGDYARNVRFPMFLLWHVFMPLVTRIVGYFPGQRLHMLEDLPKGVALEWAGRRRPEFWSHLKLADGKLDSTRVEALLARFEAVRANTLAVRFTDDPFATMEATDRILGLYRNASATVLTINSKAVESKKIGHFGFFRSRFRETLWPHVIDSLLQLEGGS